MMMSRHLEGNQQTNEAWPGQVWALLDAERHDLHTALLAEVKRVGESAGAERRRAVQEELQTRLHEVNAALDRLMSDAFGRCDNCDARLEPGGLMSDPTASLCPSCQRQLVTGGSRREH